MSRAYEEALERRQDEYVAKQLGLSVETLHEYPFSLDAEANRDGIETGVRVCWDDEAPPEVRTEGEPGSLWTRINPDYNDDYEPDDT